MDLLPKVFRTEGNVTEFDPSKIFESILKETRMSEENAKNITELVVRRIISSGIKFLSGPHIREIVCSILSEEHFENERKLYTRIGMPLMDYEKILEKGPSDKPNEQINPEKIHHWAADRIAEEYAHLRILNNEESKAHLYGDIHINGLNYFDSRPFSQVWDPRFILNEDFPPIDNLKNIYKQKPANNLIGALKNLSKWLGITHSEFYGIQGFNLISTFLAPYVYKISEEKIMKDLREFIYEINHIPIIIGRSISKSLLSSSFSILDAFLEIPAINPGGKTEKVYGDYHEESKRLLKALFLILKEEYYKNPNSIPNHQSILDNILIDEISTFVPGFWDEPGIINSTYFMNPRLDFYKKKLVEHISNNGHFNYGTLQNITLNLPRYSYMSRNEDEFLELLNSKLDLCSEILLKKFKIIEKRINSNHLPFCISKVKGEPIFNINNQNLSISIVGLNESIKHLINYELHEHSEAINLGKKILNNIYIKCRELSDRDTKQYILSENLSEKAIHRFTKLDLKHFPKQIKSLSNKTDYNYTNSIHYRHRIDGNLLNMLKDQGDFHQFIHNGAVEYISLNSLKKNDLVLRDFIGIICKDSNLSSMKFYS